jgi:metal-responsive CopG/Arc/MetJ family transcriptional regulator
MSKKFNVSLDDDVFQILDDYCGKVHMSRSAIISLSVQTYIDAQNKIPFLEEQLGELMSKLDDLKDLHETK